jgi:hypothetical protein
MLKEVFTQNFIAMKSDELLAAKRWEGLLFSKHVTVCMSSFYVDCRLFFMVDKWEMPSFFLMSVWQP